MIQVFGDLIHLLKNAEENWKQGHNASRVEKIMYLETNNDGKCKNENHTKPAIETIDDNKMLDDVHLENSAPISRYLS